LPFVVVAGFVCRIGIGVAGRHHRIVELPVAATINISRAKVLTSSVIHPQTMYRAACGLLACCLAVVAVLLLARRLAGALQNPLPPLMLIGSIAVASGIAVVIDAISRYIIEQPSLQIVSRSIATVCLPLIALSVTLPRTSPPALVCSWLLIVAAEVTIWRQRTNTVARLLRRRSDDSAPSIQSREGAISREATHCEATEANSTQQLNYRAIEGRQIVEGWFQVALAPGQRVATAHLAFCPAFDRSPEVDAECTSDIVCTIQAALVLPWGVRWEIKLDAPATEKENLRIEFIAREPLTPDSDS
jgi:hypothetical protein